MEFSEGQITILLRRITAGDTGAESELVTLVYDQLHRMARHQLQMERRGHTLQPTALVSELYVRLKFDQSIDWQDRTHLFSVVASNLRRILVDYARARNAQRRPPSGRGVELEEAFACSNDHPAAFLIANQALDCLAQFDARQAKIVELRVFAGLTTEEAAAALGISERTVKRDWKMARAWLSEYLTQNPAGASGDEPK